MAGAQTYRDAQPKSAVTPLLSEALGLTDDSNPYVYLSDGGHFENLGLYEMVLRRCRHILVVDASQDEGCRFEDLGNALRKIRIDLGVRIEFKRVPIWTELPQGEKGRYCAMGEIFYSEVDPGGKNGELLYIKPVVYDNGEPKDIVNYRKLHRSFPHESTADQWFSESQFESYRALGQYAIQAIFAEAEKDGKAKPDEKRISGIPALFAAAKRHLEELEKKKAAKSKKRVAIPTDIPLAD